MTIVTNNKGQPVYIPPCYINQTGMPVSKTNNPWLAVHLPYEWIEYHKGNSITEEQMVNVREQLRQNEWHFEEISKHTNY